jgi:hypothetical protein
MERAAVGTLWPINLVIFLRGKLATSTPARFLIHAITISNKKKKEKKRQKEDGSTKRPRG